jgi:hypothetical protein
MITNGTIEANAAGGTEFEVTEAGLFIPVDVETLVEAVYIARDAPAVVEQTARSCCNALASRRSQCAPLTLQRSQSTRCAGSPDSSYVSRKRTANRTLPASPAAS